jgi:flagellar hook-associated protein 3 FlgL
MRVNGGSDLARLQALQRQALETRNRLDVAGQELTTKLKADRFAATGGNLTRAFALERSIDRNAIFSETIGLTELRLEMMQSALGGILGAAEGLAIDLIDDGATGDLGAAMLHARSARSDFEAAVGFLNTQVAGQSLFAGTATDGAALAPAADILAELDVLAAGAPDAAAAAAAIDAYFATTPPGAFHTSGYLGSSDDLTPVEVGEGQRIAYGVRADQEEIVAVLRAQAKAAVVAGGAFAGSPADQLALVSAAGDALLAAKEGLLEVRSAVGMQQEAVEEAKAMRVAEADTLKLALNRIIAVDPLEAASTFQMLELQLQSVYTVTARLANLRFANFMS